VQSAHALQIQGCGSCWAIATVSACPAVGQRNSLSVAGPFYINAPSNVGHCIRLLSQRTTTPAAIHVGTIFGVYKAAAGADPQAAVLQPGRELVAAGYTLYSSATMLVISIGSVRLEAVGSCVHHLARLCKGCQDSIFASVDNDVKNGFRVAP
jgi:hypothetical protein